MCSKVQTGNSGCRIFKKKNRSNFVGLKIQVNVRKNIFTDL